MPDARPLGTNAKKIVRDVIEEIKRNQRAIHQVNMHVLKDEKELALELLNEMAQRESIAVMAMIYLTGNQIQESQQVLLDHRKNRSNGNHHE